ncbi:MAG TPA: FumA C-terminus/TtdB family hydratase beta subunit [Syntrophales bacterium]|nr:FumA C-terminus/TtdB family hydratase beta subunit [Syntrophales bacterium]HOX94104.1 FumA C-terminus/TtdB family hydratase beta subunit [Syntrophales bacterium]HPI55953.1 FumA C-terminus/TtdB family hydratase beta subunit [Syntrophales bacterium]HPN24157.1 FumA C-terminus/TtdB family hydratase beta subunit [Syntrophales bacterium]HQM28436.1 FumA C-terminus/TtdB family hydratase beta subunit [Syntrophales bacterium]
MKKPRSIRTPFDDRVLRGLRAGDRVLLSGEVYTARDVAHRLLHEAILRRKKIPIPIRGQTLFYAAPTPAGPGRVIGSVGPTTSSRMDPYTPKLLEAGMKGMIGKGRRSADVIEAIRKHGAVYFGAIGGVAALMAQCVRRVEVAAYGELGPEAILRFTVEDLPLVVVNDVTGGDLYEKAGRRFGKRK